MRIMHIVGNRPQFIKLAPVSAEIRKRNHEEIIIHTGQHFDENMSDVFFEELSIPKPDENLHVSGGSHTEMTARIMLELEPCITKYNPDAVVLYGDTNSTLAAAITVRKMGIPIVHVEAGPRTGSKNNPEEINRVIVDRISDVLCTPDMSSVENLRNEGMGDRTYFTGDVMYDAFKYTSNNENYKYVLEQYGVEDREYILMTWHRQENTSDKERMIQIIDMLSKIKSKIIFPIHPRTRKMIGEFGLNERINSISNLKLIEPVGYMEMVALTSHSKLILTDSGGLSKESFFADVRCMFMLDLKVWPELEKIGWVVHMSDDNDKNITLLNDMLNFSEMNDKPLFYGDGNAARKIVDLIEKQIAK
jgi:UDP-N-acetylglucosamine 2-epimerase